MRSALFGFVEGGGFQDAVLYVGFSVANFVECGSAFGSAAGGVGICREKSSRQVDRGIVM